MSLAVSREAHCSNLGHPERLAGESAAGVVFKVIGCHPDALLPWHFHVGPAESPF